MQHTLCSQLGTSRAINVRRCGNQLIHLSFTGGWLGVAICWQHNLWSIWHDVACGGIEKLIWIFEGGGDPKPSGSHPHPMPIHIPDPFTLLTIWKRVTLVGLYSLVSPIGDLALSVTIVKKNHFSLDNFWNIVRGLLVLPVVGQPSLRRSYLTLVSQPP